MEKTLKTPVILSLVLASFTIIASIGGLIWSDLYRDSEAIIAVWFVNDLITLCLAVPILLLAVYFSIKGSLKAQLVWIGSLWYLLYNYVFYLYGAQFNNFFLLYVLLFCLSIYTLIMVVRTFNIDMIEHRINNQTVNRIISGFLFFFAFALGLPWIAMALSFKLSNESPSFEMTIIIATDLTFLVSVLIFSGILLWKKNPWGLVLAAMILLKGLLYPLVLIIGGVRTFLTGGDIDTFIPLYVVLWALCIYFYRMLFKNIRESI